VSHDASSDIRRRWTAVNLFLETNNPSHLAVFVGKGLGNSGGVFHPFETRPNVLRKLDSAGELSFVDIYRPTVQRGAPSRSTSHFPPCPRNRLSNGRGTLLPPRQASRPSLAAYGTGKWEVSNEDSLCSGWRSTRLRHYDRRLRLCRRPDRGPRNRRGRSEVAAGSSVSFAGFPAAIAEGKTANSCSIASGASASNSAIIETARFPSRGILTSLFDLTGRVAIVTGSSRGIGRAIAERLAEHGATVVISSRKADACAEIAAAVNRVCGREAAKPIAANISSKDELQRLVDETNKAFGRIDILVCNAASNPYYGPMAGISDEQFRKILENNVLANHWLIQMASPGMLERNDGSIVIISSIGGLKGSPVIGAYNVSKAADIQLARNLAVEWGKHNVRVNCIAPGLIRTDFARALWENPQTLKAVTARTPLGRIGEVDEIAGAAVYLASKAGSFMTGQTIVIDGGATIAG
jgi:NAD(P)-dependent dehydrogenase (short-subunit alcohol dehydrogenase family)